jgi:hypothetical protein
MRRAVFIAAILAIWGGLGACGTYSLEPLPLSVGVEANRLTAVPGDTITFTVSAEGGTLFGVDIDFADGSSDTRVTSGARTARVTFKHAYLTTGDFQVLASATDAGQGTKSATIQILVN